MVRIAILLTVFSFAATGEPKAVFPPGVKPVGPYSPGILTGSYLYVSGQGARDAQGKLPDTFEAQVRQCLENVQSVVKAAGLTMEHVVLAQVYLADMKQYETMNRVYAQYFSKSLPARTTIGVTRMPTDTPVEISAVAVKDLKQKKPLEYPGRKMPVPVSPGVQVGKRVYLTGGLGRDLATGTVPKDAKQQVKGIMDSAEVVLKGAGLDLRHLIYVNIYVSPKMPMAALASAIEEYIPDETARTIVQTAALPFGVDLQIAGVASREFQRLGKCIGVEDTIYCSGRAGSIRQALESLKADLEANRLGLDHVVATNVYLDDIDEFSRMNAVYTNYFPKIKPARTTVQPWTKVAELSLPPATGASQPDNTPRAQVSVVAVR